MRVVAPFTADLTRALDRRRCRRRNGRARIWRQQYEVSCAPADRPRRRRPRRHHARSHPRGGAAARLSRELHAEADAVERRQWRACAFQPRRQEGRQPHLSTPRSRRHCRRSAQHFTAGVVRYMPEICALVAPSPVSYLRLGPHHWSCGYAAFGVQNREATIRACPSPDPKKQRASLQSRIAPARCDGEPLYGARARSSVPASKASGRNCPCRRCSIAIPPIIRRAERKALGVRSLPSSLGEALDLMLASKIVSGWMPDLIARVLCRGEAQGDRDVRRSDARSHVQEVSRCLLRVLSRLPLIDHHCHGVSPAELDWKQFQALFSESYRPPPPGTNEFQKPLGLAIRAFCAPLLDLEPHVSGEAYVERRLKLGAAEVNRRLMRGVRSRLPHRRYRPSLECDPQFRGDRRACRAARL